MKLIEPSVQLIKQEGLLEGMYKHIELCGRTCYKSEDKITENSAEEFVKRMIASNHTAMLEHGTVYLTLSICPTNRNKIVHFSWYYDNAEANFYEVFSYVQSIFMFNPYTKVNIHTIEHTGVTTMYITTNLRVILENKFEDIMNEFITEPTIYHTPRITLKFTTNIGVTREGNRMRANSIAEESTRYCDYSKDKFDNSIKFTLPTWINPNETEILACRDAETESRLYSNIIENIDGEEYNWNAIDWYLYALSTSAFAYKQLRKLGWSPQQAREVLPLATKSDVVYTAFPHQWRHFFDLRMFGTTGAPHPNMKDIATKAAEVLIENDLWKLIYPDKNKIPAHVGENK